VVTEAGVVRLTAWVEGRVQGVGFRWWVRSQALELGLVGYAENLADGRVKVVAEGSSGRCQDLLARLSDGTGSNGLSGSDSSWGSVSWGSRASDDSPGAGSRASDLTAGVGGAGTGGRIWPGRFRRPGRVTKVVHRWADATGDMSGFLER
jgi:acylphosphatase